MTPLAIFFLAFYACVSVLNVIFCILENERWRKITKPFCLVGLIGFVFVTDISHVWLWVSLILAWLGDVLFIFKKKKPFVIIGMFSFLLSHVFYLCEFGYIFQSTNTEIYANYCFFLRFYPLFVIPGIPVAYFLSKKDPRLTVLGSLYQSVLIMVFASSIFALANGYSLYFLFVAFGTILYYTSDFFNALTLYVKKLRKRELIIMSTYLLAQFLIVFGIYLASIA